MKLIACMLLLITLVAGFSNAQNVVIPDTVFLYALIDVGVDTDNDSLISYAEAEAISILDMYAGRSCDGDTCWGNGNIHSLIGIEAFVNLEVLDFYGHQVDTIDLSQNSSLTELRCWNNQLTNLDVSNNPALWVLVCSSNQLTSLDISNNMELFHLGCGNNQLTDLDISKSDPKQLYIQEMPTLYLVCCPENLWDI